MNQIRLFYKSNGINLLRNKKDEDTDLLTAYHPYGSAKTDIYCVFSNLYPLKPHVCFLSQQIPETDQNNGRAANLGIWIIVFKSDLQKQKSHAYQQEYPFNR